MSADLIITRAHVFTADPARPRAEAVAVGGSRLTFVGSAAEAESLRGPRTRLIDAAGRSLLPGFIDSHFHLLWGSIGLAEAQLGSVRTLDDLTTALRKFADEPPTADWLTGSGLPYNFLPGGLPLSRHHLDAIIADRPVFVLAYDHHTAWANTEALRRANLLRDGATTGPNSEIVMGSDGLAGGELREFGAYDSIKALIPKPDTTAKRSLLHQGLAQAAALGITGIHNMNGDAEEIALYAALEDAGELTLRLYCPYSATPQTPAEALAEAAALRDSYQSEMVRGGLVKFFMDGVIESGTALLLDDYADRPGRGDANFSAEHFTRLAVEADRLGLQIAVHAIGDAAVRRALDGFEAAALANGKRDSRHRVEHIELIHPDDVPRFAELGVIASMQPIHEAITRDGLDVWPNRVGRGRWANAFAWQTLRQAGARLVFGSDWPIADQNPLLGLRAALTRQPWAPGLLDQSQTLSDAILSYTRDAAYAEFQEQVKGQLRVGMLADMVLLADDIFSSPPEAIAQTRPALTVCSGRVVYEG